MPRIGVDLLLDHVWGARAVVVCTMIDCTSALKYDSTLRHNPRHHGHRAAPLPALPHQSDHNMRKVLPTQLRPVHYAPRFKGRRVRELLARLLLLRGNEHRLRTRALQNAPDAAAQAPAQLYDRHSNGAQRTSPPRLPTHSMTSNKAIAFRPKP